MRAVVLGSAAGGGFPQWNCACSGCALAWANDPRAPRRTQSSLAISDGEGGWILLNAAPELGEQIRRTPALWPKALRHSPIRAVALTGAEIDQTAGLLSLRESGRFSLLATPVVNAILNDNPMFRAVPADHIDAASGPHELSPLLLVELFVVPGKVPLYAEQDQPVLSSEAGEASGIAVMRGGQRLVYVPGCAELTLHLRQQAEKADIILFDGTLFDDDEMRHSGVGTKTGKRMGHLPISGEGGSLPWLASLPAARKIYVHLNNTNPCLIADSWQRRAVEQAGVEIAYDGMEIAL